MKMKYRIEGLQFWKMYPDDPRRYQWFSTTLESEPGYWEDLDMGAEETQKGIPYSGKIDNVAKQEWGEIYPSLKKAFLTSSSVSIHDRTEFQSEDIWKNVMALQSLTSVMSHLN